MVNGESEAMTMDTISAAMWCAGVAFSLICAAVAVICLYGLLRGCAEFVRECVTYEGAE